jgi:hypothetical protein
MLTRTQSYVVGSSVLLLVLVFLNPFRQSSSQAPILVMEVNKSPKVTSSQQAQTVTNPAPAQAQPKYVLVNGEKLIIPGPKSRGVPAKWGVYNSPGAIEKWLAAGNSGFKVGALKRSDLDAITEIEIARYLAEGNAGLDDGIKWSTNSLVHPDPCTCSPIGQINFGGDSAAAKVDRFTPGAVYKPVFAQAVAEHKLDITTYESLVQKGDFEGLKAFSIQGNLPVYLTLDNLNAEKASAPQIMAYLKSLGIYESTPTSIVVSMIDQANQAGAGGVQDIIKIYYGLNPNKSYLLERFTKLGVSNMDNIITTNNDEKIDLKTLPPQLLQYALARTVYFNANGTESNSFVAHPTSPWLEEWAMNWTYGAAKKKDPTLKKIVLDKVKAAKPGIDLDSLEYFGVSDGTSVTVRVVQDKKTTIVTHKAVIPEIRNFTPEQVATIDILGRYGQGPGTQEEYDNLTKSLPTFRDYTARMYGIK